MKRIWLCTIVFLALLQHAAAQAPVAAFSSNRQSGCAALGVTFRDESSGSPKYWSWDFGNGQFSNQQNPSVTYTQPGTYTVSLTVRNGDGAHAVTKTNYITVNASPSANFSAGSTIACAPAAIQFTDRSVPSNSPITEWYWDFGDGTTSTVQNPVKTYTEPGFYTVSLRVTSATGCVGSRAVGRMIRITPGVTAEFNFTSPSTCRPPFAITFNNQTSGPGTLDYNWTLGNSTTSTNKDPVTSYAATGTYNVTLTARSEYGCSNTITKPITLNTPVTDFSGPTGGCIGAVLTFTDASNTTALSTNWFFGNGKTAEQSPATTIYTMGNTYSVKMVNTYASCKDSITKRITISPKPAVDFSAPATGGCQAPFTVSFQASAPGATSWRWNFGDGGSSTAENPSHTYTSSGNFNVTLAITNGDGCSNTITKDGFVNIKAPSISFSNTPAGGCINYAFSPRATVDAPDGVRTYTWDFGNGQTGTGATPSTTYTTEGKFPLTLTVVTNGGCTQTYTERDAVITGTRKAASFRSATLDTCASSLIKFTNLSDASTNEWAWDFGDGTTSDEKNPSHRFKDTGNFTVKLISYYQKCASVPVTAVIHNKPPLASFRYIADCTVDGRFNFINTSKTNNNLPATFIWDFGDNTSYTGANPPAKTYSGDGPYTVKLSVTNGSCSNELKGSVSISRIQSDFTINPQPACTNSPVTLEAINSDPTKINQYQWAVDGGSYTAGTRVQNIEIPTPGNHTVRLRITDIHNCVTISSPRTVVIQGPRARFTPAVSGECRNREIIFRDQSTSILAIREWIFDFGDGTTKTFTSPPFTHSYADTGRYIVSLTAVDINGCRGFYTFTNPVVISGPVIGFRSDYTTICPKTNVTFTDTSSNNILSYRWDFGDGNRSTAQNPVHAFQGTDGNSFRIKLEVTDANGCTDSVVRDNYIVLKTPKPGFDIEDTVSICPPLETKFIFKGQDQESFYWDFGDGGASSLDNTSHFYNNFGTYTARLYVIGIGGCLDSASRTVRLINPNTTRVTFNPVRGCDTLIVDFNITTPDFTSFTFNYGDGNNDNSQTKTLQHMYTAPANYRPSIVLRDSVGCQATPNIGATIQILGAPVVFGMDKKRFCDQGQVFFTDYTRERIDPIQSRTWYFGDGVTTTDQDPSHQYTVPGTYYPKLVAVTAAGCNSEMVDTVRIYRTPTPVINSDPTVCINENLILQAGLQVADTSIAWKWDPNAATDNIVVKYGTSGTYTVRLQATNLLGCSGNTSKDIVVPPLPTITVQEDPIIPVGGSIRLPVTYTGNITTYNWTPNTSLDCVDCPNPVASPKYSTKYFVQVTDDLGCSNNQSVTVQVQCNEKNYYVPNTFSPNNDGHNDYFYPRGKGVTRINSMKIFNRWGELIFEKRNFAANDPAAGWDGKIKGKTANPDVYIYVIEFICENAAIIPFRGNVMLMR